LPNPLGLTDWPSLNVVFILTILVLLSTTSKVGASGFTVSMFVYAGFVVQGPLLPALSTALTYTNNSFLVGSVSSFTVNLPVASSYVTISSAFLAFTSSYVYSKCESPDSESVALYSTVNEVLCQSSLSSC